jgi:hypothetical protein
MNQTPTYSYDQEADILYISFAPGEKATAAIELNDSILLRFYHYFRIAWFTLALESGSRQSAA